MKQPFYFLLCLFIFSIPRIHSASLHTMIVCDTLDPSIGFSVICDLETIRRETHLASLYGSLSLKEVVLRGEAAAPQNMIENLKNIDFQEDDVFFFYFSGHGFRTPYKEDVWPYLYFSRRKVGIDINDLLAVLEKKRPRLVIFLFDCCNNVLSSYEAPLLFKEIHLGVLSSQKTKSCYKYLFQNAQGTIIASSSKPGEISWGGTSGGFFTLALQESLSVMRKRKKQVHWETIFQSATKIMEQYDLDQHPVYYFDLIYK